MENQEKKSVSGGFFRGALILTVANLLTKGIGALFKIPLINLIGDDGMGYFNIAYQIYTFMFIIATAGFPIAISKMVAESTARGDEHDARRIFQTAMLLLAVLGLTGTAVLGFFPDKLEALVSVPGSSLGIAAIAPAVFFVALTSVYRGYFQGRQNMLPTALSEVVEALSKLLFGFCLAAFFMQMTVNPNLSTDVDFAQKEVQSGYTQTIFASAGAISGVTIGTFLSFVLMTLIYFISKRKKKLNPLQAQASRSRGAILKELVLIAIPITIGASVSSLTTLIDMGTITRRLVVRPEAFERYAHMFAQGTEFAKKAVEQGWTGLELMQQKASTLYGMYTGKALTLFNLPLTLVVALGMSVVPAISASIAKHNAKDATGITESTIRIAILFSVPCALGMSVLAKEVLFLLFGDCNAQSVLALLSLAIIPVSVVSVTNAILQAYGKVYYPVINMIIGGVAKVLFNFFFIPFLGIDGAPVGTFLCYLIISLLNMRQIKKCANIKLNFVDFFLRPLLAAAIMAGVGYVAATFLTGMHFLNAPDTNIWLIRILIAAEIFVCALVYVFSAFAVRAIRREDIMNLPKGDKIADVLTQLKLLK